MVTSIKRGRPQRYSPELAKEICDVISSTSKGTKALCKEYSHWPCQDTLFTWIKSYPDFSEQYARAKKCQIELLIDEILEISDDASQDHIINAEGDIIANSTAISRAKLKIDTRKWLACKLIPKVYGNKSEDEREMNSKAKDDLLKLRDELDAKYIRDY